MARTYRFFIKNPETFSLLGMEKDFTLEEKMEPEVFFQLMKVLRCKTGDRVVFIPSSSRDFFEFHYEIQEARKKNIGLFFKEKTLNEHELSFELNLILCLPNKPDKLEFILQKAVELGTKKILLLEGEFSQMKHQLRPDRLQKIMTEAAEQSERAFIPGLEIGGKLKGFLVQNQSKASSFFVAMERLESSGLVLTEAMKKIFSGEDQSVSVVIGPEGGFSELEKEQIQLLHFPCFSLGKRILRMETAAIVSLGIITNIAQNH